MIGMDIVAHGIDLIDVNRVTALIDEHGERVLSRLFTEAERAYCQAQARRRMEHYAARFAAKEAVLKAIGTGWRNGIAWTDVEVTRQPSGEPGVRLSGRAAALAAERGITGWRISLSHTATQAIASVAGLG